MSASTSAIANVGVLESAAVRGFRGESLGLVRDWIVDLETGSLTGCVLDSGLIAAGARLAWGGSERCVHVWPHRPWAARRRPRSTTSEALLSSLVGLPIHSEPAARVGVATTPTAFDSLGFVGGLLVDLTEESLALQYVALGKGALLGIFAGAPLIPWYSLRLSRDSRLDGAHLRTALTDADISGLQVVGDGL
ncbi:MAG: hypothetical protein KDE27_29250 [Planctomycetes bacterium]|nr:hypothetical protein [Planctomycetota bacterium]